MVAQEQAYAGVDLLGPGDKAPFAVRFAAPPQTFSSYQALPVEGRAGICRELLSRPRSAQDAKGSGERYATYTVTGDVANTGPEDAVEVDGHGNAVRRARPGDRDARKAVPEHNVIPPRGPDDLLRSS